MRAIEPVSTRQKRWAELIREQGLSKLSITAFCREHGISDQSFYSWRKRLSGIEPVRFALVEAGARVTKDHGPIEVVLASGDRLRIAPGSLALFRRV